MAKQKALDAERTKLIAERIRETFGNETTTETSERLGDVTVSGVNYWKKGTNRPDYDTLIRICELYGVSADWLLGRSGAPKYPDKGAEAACEFTGLSEKALRAIKETRYKRELEYFLTDENLENFLLCMSRLSNRIFDLIVCNEDAMKISEDDRYYVEKKARYSSEITDSMEFIELANYKISEAALKIAESIYQTSRCLKEAQRKVDQLDYEIRRKEKNQT